MMSDRETDMNNEYRCKIVKYGSSEFTEMVRLRQAILRTPLGLKFSEADIEAERDQIHLALILNNEIVGTCLLKDLGSALWKMRQVCIHERLQRTGAGRSLIEFAEQYVLDQSGESITCHARDTVLGFYHKLGYQTVGDGFEEVGIPHHKMMKRLISLRD